MRRLSTLSTVMLLALGSMACGDDATSSSGSSGSIRVFAAASLSEAFTELAEAFEAAHDGTSVDLSFAGSSSFASRSSPARRRTCSHPRTWRTWTR